MCVQCDTVDIEPTVRVVCLSIMAVQRLELWYAERLYGTLFLLRVVMSLNRLNLSNTLSPVVCYFCHVHNI